MCVEAVFVIIILRKSLAKGGHMFRPGPEWIVILLVVLLLIFCAKRLPEIGSSLGRGIRTFKSAVTGEDDKAEEEPAERQRVKSNNPDDLA